MKFIKNLLPQDTRTIELTSGLCLLIASAFFACGRTTAYPLLMMHPGQYWAILTLILACIQLKSLIGYPRSEITRVTMIWMSGSFWTFYALETGLNNLSDMVSLFLGIGLLVSFLINITILSETWKK